MLTIGEFSKLSGTTVKTLRYYDEINLLKPTKVDEISGYRYYEASMLENMILIQKFKSYEFSLPKTKCVMARLEGAYTELPSIYAKLVNFIEENNYSIAGAPFDMYLTNPFEVKPEDNITEVYFPIRID